ncbi:alanine racemase [Ktedonospora formicarum]|uniref:Alanine racemase n=1 Tax=Ktedonospora formicarum TaxID=2778364 RepID=A0A8J3HRM5_9CHLR|nr:alanine racemase [Ktedonospora formicarum]GHO42617.1 alanine racemase [Ktedonospora formicarum]
MSMINRPVMEVDTPALLVDRQRLEANIRRYAELAIAAGVRLRPHIKTHKMQEVAEMQLRAGAVGITTAKLSEAEVFVEAGVKDIFIAYPVIGEEKARRAARLAQRCRLSVGVESEYGIRQLSMAAAEAGVELWVRVEIDSGLGRTGVSQERAEALCRLVLDAPGLRLDGLFTFRGASFPEAPSKNPEVLGRLEGELMVALAERLRGVGIPIQEVSVGSTPTTPAAARVPGVTEVRPGTYVFFDRMTTEVGTSKLDEIALSIIATVVSRPAEDVAIIDAGSKTFCGDIVPASAGLEGYGVTVDGEKGVVIRMNEEHGTVRLAPGFSPAIGDRLILYPNHVCTTVNLSDEVLVTENDVVRETWNIVARGKRQ